MVFGYRSSQNIHDFTGQLLVQSVTVLWSTPDSRLQQLRLSVLSYNNAVVYPFYETPDPSGMLFLLASYTPPTWLSLTQKWWIVHSQSVFSLLQFLLLDNAKKHLFWFYWFKHRLPLTKTTMIWRIMIDSLVVSNMCW